MSARLDIAFFGSSLVSAYWNGAATYYRGLIRALHQRGHRITFYEPDALDRQAHRDIDPPPWARLVIYNADTPDHLRRCLDGAADADLLIKASGVGVFDELLEAEILARKRPGNLVIFWDVDAPATLERLDRNPHDPFHELIAHYDLILTYGGGQPVVDAYHARGARACVPIYNALEPTTHHPVPPRSGFAGDLAFLGNRLPDREARVEQFFLEPARALPDHRFLLGGSGWGGAAMPGNVRWLGHVYTRNHNALNSSVRLVLNVNRHSMARCGFSPPTRLFEAAGGGACVVTDAWAGIEQFLEPGREVLVAEDGEQVAEYVQGVDADKAARIGHAALRRLLTEHTYHHRVGQLETLLGLNAGSTSIFPARPATRPPVHPLTDR